MLASALDRPIAGPDDDRLGLGPFVDGLARSLLSDDRRRARGVILGLEGPWGSGKSSILNLVERALFRLAKEADGPRPTVVRFDPWLVSGRDDLVRAFGRDLLAELDPASRRIEAERELVARLGEFIERLAPAAGAVAPGAGAAIGGGLRALLGLRRPSPSLEELRRRVRDALDRAAWPIVVLIDELDRVEDGEVRTMAQLVRSVMDFPSISFLLAYDPQRVAEALGGGASDDQRRRGEAYLEKIVQLRVPVPVPVPSELQRMFDLDFRQMMETSPSKNRPPIWLKLPLLIERAVPAVLTSIRDMKRVLATFAALEPILRSEIEPIDLLGWSIILEKDRALVHDLRHNIALIASSDSWNIDSIPETFRSHPSYGVLRLLLTNEGGGVDWENRQSTQLLGDRLVNKDRLLTALTFGTHLPRIPETGGVDAFRIKVEEAWRRGILGEFLAQAPASFLRSRRSRPHELVDWLVELSEEAKRPHPQQGRAGFNHLLSIGFLHAINALGWADSKEQQQRIVERVREGFAIIPSHLFLEMRHRGFDGTRTPHNPSHEVFAAIEEAFIGEVGSSLREWTRGRSEGGVLIRSMKDAMQISALAALGMMDTSLRHELIRELHEDSALDHLMVLCFLEDPIEDQAGACWSILYDIVSRDEFRALLERRLASVPGEKWPDGYARALRLLTEPATKAP